MKCVHAAGWLCRRKKARALATEHYKARVLIKVADAADASRLSSPAPCHSGARRARSLPGSSDAAQGVDSSPESSGFTGQRDYFGGSSTFPIPTIFDVVRNFL